MPADAADQDVVAVALLGLPGSGKSTASTHFSLIGVPVFRFGGVIVGEVQARGLDVTPESEAMVRMELRAERGEAFLATLALEWLAEQWHEPVVALDGVYTPAERAVLHEGLDDRLVTIGVVTDRSARYERLAGRHDRPITRSQAEDRDRHEIRHLHKADELVMADHFVSNNGPAREMLDGVVRVCDRHRRLRAPSVDTTAILDLAESDLLARMRVGHECSLWSLSLLLHRALLADDKQLQWYACDAIGRTHVTRGLRFLKWIAEHPDRDFDHTSLHRIAAAALARSSIDLSGYLMEMLEHGTPQQQSFAADALGEMRDATAVDRLAGRVRDGEWSVAMWAALSLAKIGEPASSLLTILASEVPWPRCYLAFDALVRIDPTGAASVIEGWRGRLPADGRAALEARLSEAQVASAKSTGGG
jgi:dephospho-CoA kinase